MAKKALKSGDPVEFARAWMRLGHFARTAGLTAGRVSQLRAEGAIVGRKIGRGVEVDVRATIARVGRPDWVWVGVDDEGEVESDAPPVAPVAEAAATPLPPAAQDAGEVTAADYYTARARREAANACLAELRLSEARGEMIAADAVERYCIDTSTVIRERVMEVERLAMTQMPPAAHAWLAQALRSALGEASRSMRVYTERLFGAVASRTDSELEAADAE